MRQHALLDLFFEGSPSFFDCFSALEGLDVKNSSPFSSARRLDGSRALGRSSGSLVYSSLSAQEALKWRSRESLGLNCGADRRPDALADPLTRHS